MKKLFSFLLLFSCVVPTFGDGGVLNFNTSDRESKFYLWRIDYICETKHKAEIQLDQGEVECLVFIIDKKLPVQIFFTLNWPLESVGTGYYHWT